MIWSWFVLSLVGCQHLPSWPSEDEPDPKSNHTAPDGTATSNDDLPSVGCGPGVAAYADGVSYETGQAAMDRLDNFDNATTISFCPGIHEVEADVILWNDVILESVTGDRENTVLTGAGQHRILRAMGTGIHVTVRDLTLQDTRDTALEVVMVNSLRVENCIFRDNRTMSSGAAIAAEHLEDAPDTQPIQILDSIFERNIADDNGGALMLDGMDPQRVLISGSEFIDNEAVNHGGGAIGADPPLGTDIQIVGCNFAGNVTDGNGGAIEASYEGSLTVQDCTFTDNESREQDGGAIYLRTFFGPTGIADISTSTFHRNGSGYAVSGAVAARDWTVFFTDVDFGEGLDTNFPRDVSDCAADLPANVTLTYDPGSPSPCQQ